MHYRGRDFSQPITNGSGQEDGTNVSVSIPGYINTVCYPVASGDSGTDPINLWVNGTQHGPFAGNGAGCAYVGNVAVGSGDVIHGTYEPTGNRFADTPDPGSTSSGALTYLGPIWGGTGSNPSTDSGMYGFGVSLTFYSLPVMPNATLTPTATNTASFSYAGDGEIPYGETEPWTCAATARSFREWKRHRAANHHVDRLGARPRDAGDLPRL